MAAAAAWLRLRRAHLAVAGGLVLLSLVQRPGETTFDTKLDLTENPWGFLDRALSLWNPQANLGELQNQAYGYLFPVGPFFAVGQAVGLPSWVVQRLWSALLLVVAYAGVVALCRALPVGTRWSRILAGVAYALCPRMVTTLGPISAEALVVALLPWTALPLLRWQRWGVRRSAALSALGVAAMGAANATLTLAVLPFAGLVALTRPRGVRRRLSAWWAACVGLACAWWVIPLVLLARHSPPFLDYIESAANTTGGVGIPDAVRGTTHWVAGVSVGGHPWWPAAYELVTSDWLLISTSVTGVVGLVALLDPRVPSRAALLGSASLGLLLLSLGWDGPLSSPLAGVWRELLDGPLAAFRNVHKFDPLVRLPAAIGVAHAVGLLLTVRRQGRVASLVRGAGVIGVATCVLAPLVVALSPGLRPGPGWDGQPAWWHDAAQYVAERDSRARTLVLPSSGFGTQVWGRTVDEPLQPLAEAPWVSRSQVFLGGEGASRLLTGLDAWIESGRGSPVLGDVLARAGIRFVLLRADLNRGLSGTPPVAVVRQALERSGGISSVARFGPVLGTGGAAGLRVSGFAVDASTPAIEIFEVERPVPTARLAAVDDIVGVSGGPESIPRLIEDRLLDADRAAVLAMDGADDPAHWLVTDDLARRERGFGRIRENLGPLLTADEPVRQERAASDVIGPDADGHQTVARYRGITAVSASTSRGYPDAALATSTALGPWSAVDGDPFTAWRSDSGGNPVGQWIRIALDEATSPRSIAARFVDASLVGPRVRAVDVRTESGVERSVVRGDGSLESLDVPGGWTDFVQVEIADVEGEGDEPGEVGIIDLELPGIDTERIVAAPADQPAAVRRSAVADGFSFHRLDPTRSACVVVGFSTRCDPSLVVPGDEPTSLVRAFTTHGSATFRLDGTVSSRPGSDVQRLLEPLAGMTAEASSTLAGDPGVAAMRAVDGNPATSWVADSSDLLPTLRLAWRESREIDGFRIQLADHPVAARPTAVRIQIGAYTRELDVVDGWVRFPPRQTDHLDVTVTDWTSVSSVDPRTHTAQPVPPGIAELQIPGVEDLVVPPDMDAPTGQPCGFGPDVLIDGIRVSTEVEGTVRDLLENRPLRWSACGDEAAGVGVRSGQHTLEVRASRMFVADGAVLRRSPVLPRAADDVGTVTVTRWDSTHRTVDATTDAAALLVVPENGNSGWIAHADGVPLPAVRVDGWQQAWELPAGFDGEVTLLFTPQDAYEAGLGIGAAALAVLVGLAAVRARKPVGVADRPRHRAIPGPVRPVMAGTATVAFGGLIAGAVGAITFAAAAVLRLDRRRLLIVGAVLGVVALTGVAVSALLDQRLDDDVRMWTFLPVIALIGAVTVRVLLRAEGGVTTPSAIRGSVVGLKRRWSSQRPWITVAYVLVALQLGWRAWALSHSFFWQDDFVYVHRASQGLSLDYLLQDYKGHLMPGQFLLSWGLTELAPLSWLPAAMLVLVLQAVASLLVLRLVRALAGDGPLSLALVAVYLFSPLAFTASVWWASALQAVPLQLCMAWAVLSHLHHLRTGSRLSAASALLAVVVGLLFWQKALLIPLVLLAFTVLVGPLFTGRALRSLLRRSVPALVGYLVVGAGYATVYVIHTAQDGSSLPTPTEVLQLLQFAIADTFAPSLFGVMGGAEPAGALLAPTPSPLVLLASWQVLGVAMVASLVLARWTALRAWALLLGYLLVDVALVASTRLDFVGTVIGRDPRYVVDAVVVAVVALAGVGVAVGRRHDALPPALWRFRAAVASGLVLALVNASLISTFAVVQRLPMDDAGRFVTNARDAAATSGPVDLVDGAVPDFVIAPFFVEQARASVVVGALSGLRFGRPSADLRMLDGFGLPQPIDIRPAAAAAPGERSSPCAWPLRGDRIDIPLDATVPAGRWVVRIGYYSAAPTTGVMWVGPRRQEVDLLDGVHRLYLEYASTHPVRQISIGGLPAGDAACVTDVVVGAPWPRQAG
jgi:arabinofuranan 3-O-arabinosyltransferase